MNIPSAKDYHRYDDQRDHILDDPNMYIGSCLQQSYETRILEKIENGEYRMKETTITIPEGVERLYLEILSNASDNVDRSRKAKVDIGKIEIMMDKKTISIKNGGVPIPIEIHPEFNVYVPEMILGTLLSGSNFDKDKVRTGIGRNGLGSKLCNIFSNSFMVHIGDSFRKIEYKQIWNGHMKIRGEPIIKEGYKGESFVHIIYELDFKYFKYKEPEEGGGYPEEAIKLFMRHAADVAFTCKVPVKFNGIEFDYQDINKYGRLYFGEKMENAIVHYEWDEGIESFNKKGKKIKIKKEIPIVELCVIDTPDEGNCISFVNGLITRNGGVHVNTALRMISTGILEKINENKVTEKGKKGEKKRVGLTMNDVKPHISMIISCRLENPEFDSQTKNMLKSPIPKMNIPDRIVNNVMKWELVNRLYATLEAKNYKNLTKTDGKKRRHITLLKGEDANEAGTKNSGECTLYVTEGKSAMGYAVKAISLLKNGRDKIGVYPMKGKPLNVMNADPEQIAENNELCDLKKMLGLREGVDYMKDENFETLRYGHFIILADSDDDGKHIVGLILNMFHCRYPSLLMRGYVMYLRTPILRTYKGKNVNKFYTRQEYETWKNKTNDYETWKHKYYKGLGSSKDEDIEDDFKQPRVVVCIYDDSAPDVFRLAFDDKLSNERKKWIAEHKPILGVEELQMQPISQFLYYEFVEYSISNVARSIPRFLDGLKESQRKAIWGAIKKWGGKKWSTKIKTGNVEEFKVARFASYIAEETCYHHGEKCLSDTIVSMANSYVGSNNLSYFTQDGQFGTRNMGGEDAADTRYSFTRPEWWLPYIFKDEDLTLLTQVIDEGESQEPITFLPIIPLSLINGCNGIGTGHSTFIPNHNPIDICNWIKAKINNKKLPTIIPWYRGFNGNIKIGIKTNKNENTSEEDPLEPDHVDFNQNNNSQTITDKISLITTGLYNIQGNNVIVTELPIGRSMHKYKQWLDKLIEDKKITDYRNLSTHDKVYFEISGFQNPSIINLRLQRSFGLSNMVLLDINNHPIKYNTITDILETFYSIRLPYYELRRQHIISNLQSEINKLDERIKLIQAIINEQIIIWKNKKTLPKSDIISQLQKLNLNPDLLKSINLYHLSDEDVISLINEMNILIKEKQTYENMPATLLWTKDIDDFLDIYYKHYK